MLFGYCHASSRPVGSLPHDEHAVEEDDAVEKSGRAAVAVEVMRLHQVDHVTAPAEGIVSGGSSNHYATPKDQDHFRMHIANFVLKLKGHS